MKPRLRGAFHFYGFFVAALGVIPLALSPLKGAQYTAGIVYGVCLALMLGLSGCYHYPMWSPRARELWRRIDHAGVYLLIAGSYSPMAIYDAKGELPWNLYAMWAAALIGAVTSATWTYMPRVLRALIYVVLGLTAAPLLVNLIPLLGGARVFVLALGSAIYILGAAVYARRWPNPNPAVLGYHEVFHAMVLLSALLHYVVILDVQLGG